MNAYHELFVEETISARHEYKVNEAERRFRGEKMNEQEIQDKLAELRHNNPNKIVDYDSETNKFWISPLIEDAAAHWNVLWGFISGPSDTFFLKSEHDAEAVIAFLTKLYAQNYYSGYGGQELGGEIAMNDGSWYERGEYDGSEWWEHKRFPKEPDWDEFVELNQCDDE